MPEYPIPPWLRPPPDPGQQFLEAHQHGANIASAQAQLANSSAQAQMRMELEAQQKQREFGMEQQRIEIGKQQHAIEVGMQKQKLEQESQLNQMRIKQMSQRWAEQQGFQQDVAGGMDPMRAILKHPGMFPSAAGLGTAYRALQPQPTYTPQVIRLPDGSVGLSNPHSGAFYPLTRGQATSYQNFMAAQKIWQAQQNKLAPDANDRERAKKLMRPGETENTAALRIMREEQGKAYDDMVEQYRRMQQQQQGYSPAELPPGMQGQGGGQGEGGSNAVPLKLEGGQLKVVPQKSDQSSAAYVPSVTLADFKKRLDEGGWGSNDALVELADQVAAATGYSTSRATQTGDSRFHFGASRPFLEALATGKTDKLPGLTRESIEAYLDKLPAKQRNAMLAAALKAGGLGEDLEDPDRKVTELAATPPSKYE